MRLTNLFKENNSLYDSLTNKSVELYLFNFLKENFYYFSSFVVESCDNRC